MTDFNEENRRPLQWHAELHQDVIDDSLVNPVPGIVEQLVANVYAEAEHRGATIVQWRITFGPPPLTNYEDAVSGSEELAYLAGRRVMKMTAHTVGGAPDCKT
jgi:hypothetical protein